MKIGFTAIGLLLSSALFAQDYQRCGSVEAIELRNAEQAGYSKAVQNTFNSAKQHASQKDVNEPSPIYMVPVVVHIVYNTPEENISDALVHAQIARLNKDYRRLNDDTTDTRAEFLPVAADAGIQFYLAGTDPNGSPTGGITRTQVTRTDFAPDFLGNGLDDVKQSSLGGVASWDTDEYLNIWVCDLIGTGGIFQIFGFAYPPASAPNWPQNNSAPSPELEGVVIHFEVFGDGNPLATGPLSVADRGRTAVHEVGHYLGLRHIWGDAFFDGCTEDDGLDDTPNAASNAAQVCNFNNNTCVDTPVDYPDMIENYMDYAQDQCMNLFTANQVGIMRSMLETARVDLADGSVSPSGIEELILDNSMVTVFPNPSEGLIQLNYSTDLHLTQASLFDVNGKLLQLFETKHVLNIQSASGVYVLKLQFSEGLITKRISIL